MTSETEIPTQAEFLVAPDEAIAAVAPRSMVYAPGGTRRKAVFAGVEPWTQEYLTLLLDQFTDALGTIFRYDVKHVFTPMVMAGHVKEVNDIERQLILPLGKLMTDSHLIDTFRARGWRLRIAPSAYEDMLNPFMQFLDENTPQDAEHTWWVTCTPSHESWWSNLFKVAKSAQVSTRGDAIRALYGEEIPTIDFCLSFGKLMVSPDLFPPLLMDNVQCYWSQQVGCSLTDLQFRKVLYDYAYLRQTWQKDKTARASAAQAYREIWEKEVILGLGTRLGPFWYPDLSSSPDLI